MSFCLITELLIRHQAPLLIRVILLSTLLIIAVFYGLNRSWFTSLKILSLLPFQRFEWQSEKYSSDIVIKIGSLILTVLSFTIAIYSYQLGPIANEGGYSFSFIMILIAVLLLFIIKYLANKLFYRLHISNSLGDQVIDYHYSLNQWLSFSLIVLLLIDIFYQNLHSGVFYFIMVLAVIYFLFKLFGTILMLQNNFKYSVFAVFVYLCTFEIVPALVVAKVLFVNS